jgi:hypothetical protein
LELSVDSKELVYFRKKLNRTQKEMAQLLGTSAKAVRSYEQGWRKVPGYVERQLLFLISQSQKPGKVSKPCWSIKKCATEQKKKCPAWEFRSGHLCWFINGTICCEGEVQRDWNEKMKKCRKCEVLKPLLNFEGRRSQQKDDRKRK